MGSFATVYKHDEQVRGTQKRIIICCDGTWQTSVSGKKHCPSNITRLARVLNSVAEDEQGTKWHQVVWYDAGVGSNSMKVGRVIQGALGNGVDGVDGNIIEAYNFISLNWNKGDQIICFGFSRGAYTARAIAGLISDVGICRPKDLDGLPELWNIYKEFHSDENHAGEDFYCSEKFFKWQEGTVSVNQAKDYQELGQFAVKKSHNDWAQDESRYVHLVGVFDTVAALGPPEVGGVQIPVPSSWGPSHNVQLSRNIGRAFQALALDEYRRAFSPTLFFLPPPVTKATQEEVDAQKKVWEKAALRYLAELNSALQLKPTPKGDFKELDDAARRLNTLADQTREAKKKLVELQDSQRDQPQLTQVWFPGYHINIGGGSNDTLKNEGDMEEMSSITFAWMLEQIRPYLSINDDSVNKERVNREKYLDELNRKAELKPEPWGHWLSRSGKSVLNALSGSSDEPPKYQPEKRGYNWGMTEMTNSFDYKYLLNGWRTRTPGMYSLEKAGKKATPSPETDRYTEKTTCEWIHPTVGFRVANRPGYFPSCLKKEEYNRRKSDDGYLYKLGNAILREWPLGGPNSYEWKVITGDIALNYVVKEKLGMAIQAPNYMNLAPPNGHHIMNSIPTSELQGSKPLRITMENKTVLIPIEGLVADSLEVSAEEPLEVTLEESVKNPMESWADLSDYQVGGFSLNPIQ